MDIAQRSASARKLICSINMNIWYPLKRWVASITYNRRTLEHLLQFPENPLDEKDLFAFALSHDEFRDLLQHYRPQNAKACAGNLSARMRIAIIRFSDNQGWDESLHFFCTTFFPRVLAVLDRIATIKDGALPALDLCIFIKLDILHGKLPLFCDGDFQRANRDIDGVLRLALHSARRVRKDRGARKGIAQAPQRDAAYLSRSIRRFCEHYSWCEHHFTSPVPPHGRRGCVRVNTAVALDLLERHAYTKIKLDVYRVVGRKLPKELADLVLRFALLAHNVPERPGVFDSSGRAVIECEPMTIEVLRTDLK